MPKTIDESKVLSTALELLVAQGYQGATTQEIAEAAGVNEVTLFRRYGNKEGLFEAAIRTHFADTPLNRLAYTGDLEADTLAVVEAYVETNQIFGDVVQILMLEMERHPELRGSFQVLWNNLWPIVEMLRTYQKEGRLRRATPLHALGALVGPLMVNGVLRRADLELPVPKIDPGSHVRAFLQGWAA